MDKDIFYISLFMILVGIGGQLAWYFYGGIACPVSGGQPYLFNIPCNPNATAASFQEMQNISGLMMVVGFILLPAGLFKDGLPAPGRGAKVFLGVVLILLAGLTFTAIVSLPHPAGTAATAQSFVTILPGSSVSINSTSHPGDTFYPKVITVILGVNSTVEWTNDDSALHSVTSLPNDTASFGSNLYPSGSTGDTFTYSFTAIGTYDYHCVYHSWMMGEVIVKS
jgi:plastocyanin